MRFLYFIFGLRVCFDLLFLIHLKSQFTHEHAAAERISLLNNCARFYELNFGGLWRIHIHKTNMHIEYSGAFAHDVAHDSSSLMFWVKIYRAWKLRGWLFYSQHNKPLWTLCDLSTLIHERLFNVCCDAF